MGQSNSTSPILPQSYEINFSYSRLLLKKDYLQLKQTLSSNSKNGSQQLKKTNKQLKNAKNIEIINFDNNFSISMNNMTKYSLDKFEAVKIMENQLVKERQERLKLSSNDEEDDDQYERITTNSNVNQKNSSYLDVNNNNNNNNNNNHNNNNNNNKNNNHNNNNSNKNLNNNNSNTNTSNKNLLQTGSNKKLHLKQSKRTSIIPHIHTVAFARLFTMRIAYPNFVIVKKSHLSKQKVKIINYFTQQLSMQNYMSNLIKIKQVLSSNNNNGSKGEQMANTGLMSTSNHLPNINNNSKINSSSSKSSSSATLYEDFNIFTQNQLIIIQREFPSGVLLENSIKYHQLQENIYLFMDVLCFLVKFYEKIDNLFIDPLNIIMEENGKYYLLDFKYMKIDLYQILASILEWVYWEGANISNQKDKDKAHHICTISNMNSMASNNMSSMINNMMVNNSNMNSMVNNSNMNSMVNNSNMNSMVSNHSKHTNPNEQRHQIMSLELYIQQKASKDQSSPTISKFPIYIKQLYFSLLSKQICRSQLYEYCSRIRSKLHSLSNNMDSFHACLNYKRTVMFTDDSHNWILGKKYNQIYFFNVEDLHCCQVKIIRKKKKVDLNSIKLIFDSQELEIKYIAENSKLILHAGEFQLEKHSSLSDIQIRYKLPVKFKSPYSFIDSKNINIYILQSCVYRYYIPQNKLIQQTKKSHNRYFCVKTTNTNS